MSPKETPGAANSGGEVDSTGSEIDVPIVTVNPMTGEVLTETEAARLTTKIQLRLGMIADSVEQVVPLIQRAHDTRAHEVLGYRSWGEYVADKFGGTLGRLTKAQRIPVVEMLASQGVSTRQIGPVVGAAFKTVARDLEAAVSSDTATSSRIPVTLAEASVELESIDAFLTELRREQHALRCYLEAYEGDRGDVR